MSMMSGNPLAALAGISGGIAGEDGGYRLGANISPEAAKIGGTIGGLVGGMALDPESLLKIPKINAGNMYNYINHGFRRSSEILPLRGRYNTLRRFVGVGTSGLDDAVESGVIRGKTENPVPHTAH